MKYLIAFILCIVVAVACVSPKLGSSNLDAVNALAELAVQADPANLPLAEKASADAAVLANATETGAQITSLGVPDELAEQNHKNIGNLIGVLDLTKPEVKVAADEAMQIDKALSGRTHAAASFKAAASSTPWTATALTILEAFGVAVGGIYGVTRGPMHVKQLMSKKKPAPGPGEIA